MFYKLSCGCTAQVTDEMHDADGTLMQVNARTVDYCGGDIDDVPYYFRKPVVYERDGNGDDTWDKIQNGHKLTPEEEAEVYERINKLLVEGWKYRQLKQLLA